MNEVTLRKFKQKDEQLYFDMSKKFYQAGASINNFEPEICKLNFDGVMNDSKLLKGFFIQIDDKDIGFILLSFGWSTDAGGEMLFLEEIYIDDQFRGLGLGSNVIDLIFDKYKDKIKRFRLEVCDENHGARKLYEKKNFDYLDYKQMILDV